MLHVDQSLRIHLFRQLAQSIYNTLPASDKQWLEAYNKGVGSGLDQLKVRPLEYLLLREQAVPWADEDPILVMLSFHLQLQSASLETSLTIEAIKRFLLNAVY